MAVTVKVEPEKYHPAFNEVVFVFDSDNKAKSKFEYVIKLEIDYLGEVLLNIQTNPQGFGIVDISKHLQNFISFNLPGVNMYTDLFNKSNISYDLSVAERFSDIFNVSSVANNSGKASYNTTVNHNFSVGDFVIISGQSNVPSYNGLQEVVEVNTSTRFTTTIDFIFTSLGTSGGVVRADGSATTQSFVAVDTYYALNNVIKYDEVWNASDYYQDFVQNAKFLTNVPSDSICRLDDTMTFNYFHRAAAVVDSVRVIMDDNRTYFFDVDITQTNLVSINVGCKDLLNNTPSVHSGSSSVSPIIQSDTKYYTVQLIGGGNLEIQTSELKKITIDRSCPGEGATTLTYLNTGGSWSVFHFLGERAKQVSNKKTTYRKNFGGYNVSSNAYQYNKSDRGLTVLDSDINEVHTINTKYLRSNEGDLIQDLINSPEVYEVRGSNLYAVNLKTDSLRIKKKSIDKLISYTINFEYSNKNGVQK